MNPSSCDTIARRFAGRRLSRRQAVAQGGTGLAAGALAVTGLGTARAQEATPAATPPAGEAVDKTMFLFVQSFQAGTIAPVNGTEDRYTLTLEGGLGQTIYFSDRPERIVGTTPTPQFLDGLGFPPDNPPNAALVVETANGETEIAVVELFAPSYDEATHTATYEVAVLAEWESVLEVGLIATPADLAAFGDSFGAAHLFIDDCANGKLHCLNDTNPTQPPRPQNVGFCYDPGHNTCIVCDPTPVNWANVCNQWFPDYCMGTCEGYLVVP